MKDGKSGNYSRTLLKRMTPIPDILRSEIDGSWGQKERTGHEGEGYEPRITPKFSLG